MRPRTVLGWTAGVVGALMGLVLFVFLVLVLINIWFPGLLPRPPLMMFA